MALPDKDLAAGGTVEGTYAYNQLFAGDQDDVITEEAVVVAGQNLAKYTVVGRIAASGKLAVYNPAAVDGTEKAIGILTQAANAVADTRVAIFTAGFFNHTALVWPAGVATLLARQDAFRATTGHQIRIGAIRL